MENKLGGIGVLIMLAVTIIVGLILIQGSAQNTNGVLNTVTLVNTSFTAPAESGSVYFTDYKVIDSVVIYNSTGSFVPAANYTVTNNVIYNGALATKITYGVINSYANDTSKISGVAQPLTYSSDNAGRSMTSLIIIMSALALAVVTIGAAIKMYKE
jgi:hypothetical protein